jgi:AcrR family transcriptional regulator
MRASVGSNVDTVKIKKPQNVDGVNMKMKNRAMSRKRPYHHPDLRQALLDGAMQLIDEKGLRGFSLRKLATHAGVSHAAPYRHFAGKEEILVTLMLEGHKRLRQALVDAEQGCKGSAGDKHLALTRAYLAFARKNPEYLRVMFSREALAAALKMRSDKDVHGSDYNSFGVLEANVRRCQDEGSLPADADAGVLSLLSWAEVHGLALLCNEGLIREMSEERGGSEKRTLDAIFAAIKGRLVPKR